MASNNKRRRQELESSRRECDEAVKELKKEDPNEAYVKAEDRAFLDAYSGKSGPVDVATLPGLSPHLDLFNRAKSGRARRASLGAATFGSNYSSPEFQTILDREMQSEDEENAAGGLEEAVAGRYAEARGSVLPLAQLNLSRRNAVMGFGQDRYNQAYEAANRPSPLYGILGGLIGAAGVAAGGYLGRK